MPTNTFWQQARLMRDGELKWHPFERSTGIPDECYWDEPFAWIDPYEWEDFHDGRAPVMKVDDAYTVIDKKEDRFKSQAEISAWLEQDEKQDRERCAIENERGAIAHNMLYRRDRISVVEWADCCREVGIDTDTPFDIKNDKLYKQLDAVTRKNRKRK